MEVTVSIHLQAAPQRLPSRDMGPRSRSASRKLVRTASRDSERLSRLSSAAQMASVQSWLTQKARRAVVVGKFSNLMG